ncbi:MAG: BatA and WFA domain-containing protein, partial [Pseudomonadota bacterium]
MSLTFLNPLLLFGLAAATLPILIHRITQRRVIRRRFSAVHLLLQSQRITAKQQRLRHLLVLALRILAIAAIVFMMARPVLMRPGFATLLEEGAMVLILDNSLSMGYEDDRGQRYQAAKKAATEALQGFEGSVALIPTVNDRSGQGFQWMKPKAALRELETLPLSFGPGDTPSAFKSAYQQLQQLKLPKQILVISDMARSDWQRLDLTGLRRVPDADVTFLKIGHPGRDANFCVKDVRLADVDMVAGVANRLEVTVSNLSDQTGTRLVQIYLAGAKVHQKSLEVEGGRDGTVSFDLRVDAPGWIDGEVTLSPDRLAADDRFYFSLNVRDKIKILAVDGDPKTSLKAGESYFVVSALRPEGMEGSPFLIRVITEDELAQEALGS